MAKTSPVQFFKEVRLEARKVTWPTWKETWISTVMVFVMGLLAALFFFLVDQGLSIGIRLILGLGK
ncbi:preprotein translocase subunit SecE [Elstera litoralis]|uniref:Protein translocase subunit SecE n=2 Tax=Elstera litoralis TaxID=552518 RepID=A0A0F3IJS9_9PROT|nr:preprotein translocase subunit SecE [Elstera litoralis]KJV06927.1 preprotein translocase subunit SecE [Elstera litoralis]